MMETMIPPQVGMRLRMKNKKREKRGQKRERRPKKTKKNKKMREKERRGNATILLLHSFFKVALETY